MAAHPAGKGLMSDEVRQALMDDEACEVASSNWRPATVPSRWSTVWHVAGIVAAFTVVANIGPVLAGVIA